LREEDEGIYYMLE